MRTAYCPDSHEQIAEASVGRAYGHVPGHQYHDVDVVISMRPNVARPWRCHVVESWGSAQGYDEEHGRREAVGRGASIEEACQSARDRAESAGIECEYLESAICLAEDRAEEQGTEEQGTDA